MIGYDQIYWARMNTRLCTEGEGDAANWTFNDNIQRVDSKEVVPNRLEMYIDWLYRLCIQCTSWVDKGVWIVYSVQIGWERLYRLCIQCIDIVG